MGRPKKVLNMIPSNSGATNTAGRSRNASTASRNVRNAPTGQTNSGLNTNNYFKFSYNGTTVEFLADGSVSITR